FVFSVLVAEFENTGSIQQCEGVTASVLDEFVVKKYLSEDFKALFFGGMLKCFEAYSPEMEAVGKEFLQRLQRFIELAQDVEKYSDMEDEDEKVSAILAVMDY